MREFAVFDIDWTLHGSALGTDLLLAFSQAGLTTRKLDDEYAEWQASSDRSTYFKEHFMEIYESGLANVSRVQIEKAGKYLATNVEKKLYAQLREEIAVQRSGGKFLIAITQSPSIAALPLTELLGFDVCTAPDFEYDESGIYTGPHHRTEDEKDKGKVLTRLVNEHGLTWDGSTAYGDSMDDLTMLELVIHPTVVNPVLPLREVAEARNWRIITTD